ncbi:MAG: hypothetical protein QOD76_1542 [Solirubrobacteraceae bacterium]|nr:hypothetical protein [Solirubrobacteraceae bacterium]
MPADAKLVVMFAALHLLGLMMVALLLVVFLRSDTQSAGSPPEEGDGGGGGGNDRVRPRRPGGPRDGGLPLPDADQARLRLRDHRRLAELLPPRVRRPAPEPEPARMPRRAPSR